MYNLKSTAPLLRTFWYRQWERQKLREALLKVRNVHPEATNETQIPAEKEGTLSEV